ncbi:hypothetical protein NL676_012095 [Syzygium grande]|nr:hypothetical protein NL676_012095 [Syzygium grande]
MVAPHPVINAARAWGCALAWPGCRLLAPPGCLAAPPRIAEAVARLPCRLDPPAQPSSPSLTPAPISNYCWVFLSLKLSKQLPKPYLL